MTVRELTERRGGFVDVYEALAATFRRTSRMLAPGKDYPAETGEPYTWEERRAAWQAFGSLLGPSDKACVIAEYLRSEYPEESAVQP